MRLINSLIISFAMYSKIPMPRVEWTKRNMRYAMCFFPLIGVFIALAQWGWIYLCEALAFSPLLTGAGMAIIPIAITGGIHADGFIDTCDALASHQPTERKLEILKDSHTGAFAIITFGIYLIFYVALASNLQFETQTLLILGGGYVLERCLSGFSVTTFKCAKNRGLLYTFADGATKKTSKIVLVTTAIAVGTYMIYLNYMSVVVIAVALLVMLYYYVMSKRQFGGITGDIAGCFVQLCEICMLFALVVTQRIGDMI